MKIFFNLSEFINSCNNHSPTYLYYIKIDIIQLMKNKNYNIKLYWR